MDDEETIQPGWLSLFLALLLLRFPSNLIIYLNGQPRRWLHSLQRERCRLNAFQICEQCATRRTRFDVTLETTLFRRIEAVYNSPAKSKR